jgi:hypothetical protein
MSRHLAAKVKKGKHSFGQEDLTWLAVLPR